MGRKEHRAWTSFDDKLRRRPSRARSTSPRSRRTRVPAPQAAWPIHRGASSPRSLNLKSVHSSPDRNLRGRHLRRAVVLPDAPEGSLALHPVIKERSVYFFEAAAHCERQLIRIVFAESFLSLRSRANSLYVAGNRPTGISSPLPPIAGEGASSGHEKISRALNTSDSQGPPQSMAGERGLALTPHADVCRRGSGRQPCRSRQAPHSDLGRGRGPFAGRASRSPSISRSREDGGTFLEIGVRQVR